MMKYYDVVVVGAGPAGMMASIEASRNGCRVALLERNDLVAKKLKITGGGRCNITSNIDITAFFDKIPHNRKFLYKAFKTFTNRDLLDLLGREGIRFRSEGTKVYPVSDRSEEVIETFLKLLKKQRVDLYVSTMLKDFSPNEEGYRVETSRDVFQTKAIILASGGNSFPALGSDWNIHRLMEKWVRIRPPLPALVQIHSNSDWITGSMGISLEDAVLTIWERDKKLCHFRGSMIFTHRGVSGPIVLDASSEISGKDLKEIRLKMDLLPDMEEQDLLKLLKNKADRSLVSKLSDYLPKNLLRNIFADIDEKTDLNNLKKAELKALIDRIKNANMSLTGLGTIKEAIVTRGGVDVKEIDPSTMELKKLANIFVAGEMIDVDAFTGGYNLQIAFSTGALAGRSVAKKIVGSAI